MYQLPKSGSHIIRISDGATIPCSEANADWRAYQAWRAAGNEPLVSPLATAQTIAAAKLRVALFADQMAAAVTGPVPETERASWPTKELAARAYLAGNAAPSQIAMLQAECNLTGETIQHLAQTIVTNADSYVAIAGLIVGQRRVTMAALDALVIGTATEADVDAVLATAKAQAEALLANLT